MEIYVSRLNNLNFFNFTKAVRERCTKSDKIIWIF